MSFEASNTSIKKISSPAGVARETTAQTKVFRKEEAKTIQNSLGVQPKLTVGSPDDPYEKEADTVADKVMLKPEQHFIQRKCAHCEKEEKIQTNSLGFSVTPFIQTKSRSTIPTVSASLSQSIQSAQGGGSSLDPSTSYFMSSRFGTDFSQVKVHTDTEAVQMNQQLNARAFTLGSDVYFNQGQYQPGSSDGKRLLSHELTHVLQQDKGTIRRCVNPQKNDPLYDAIAKQIKSKPAYTALADKSVADGIITDAKKKGACIYYIGKLKALF